MRYGWQTWCVAHTGVARTFEQGDQSEGTGRGWEDFENCYFFQYFVGTSETLSVQMTGLHKLRKSIIGAKKLPPPPPLATLMSSGEGLWDVVSFFHAFQSREILPFLLADQEQGVMAPLCPHYLATPVMAHPTEMKWTQISVTVNIVFNQLRVSESVN